MKLTKADAVNLNNILNIALLAKIESLVIDVDGVISGLNMKNAAMITNENVPRLPQKAGLGRLSVLRSRLNLALSGDKDVSFEAKESDRGEITQLELINGKTKVQYRCSATSLIKAPKNVNDPPLFYITIKADQLKTILDSIKVMGAEQICLVIKRDGLTFFEVADSTNDKVTTELDKKAEVADGVDEDDVESVVHYYSTEIFSSLFKAGSDDNGISFSVGESGTLNFLVQSHSIHIFSQIDT